jgi:uncharacterized membrane protein YqiK
MQYMPLIIGLAVLFVFLMLLGLLKRYKRCPSDRVMVVYGKIGAGPEGHRSAKCIHGGASFIWPVLQDYSFMDLTPISIEAVTLFDTVYKNKKNRTNIWLCDFFCFILYSVTRNI